MSTHLPMPAMAILGLLVCCLLLLVAGRASADQAPRGPIRIQGGDAFAPADGVCAGNGTAWNPYIIEDQVIYVDSAIGILFNSDHEHYLVRNITIIGSDRNNGYGIDCIYSSNVTVDGLVVRNLSYPIYVMSCDHMRFRNVTAHDCLQGIRFWDTSFCTFVNVSIADTDGIGLSATGCSNLSLDGCSARNVSGGGFAFDILAGTLPDCRNISLKGCAASEGGVGLSFAGADGCTVDGCNFSGGWRADMYLKDTRNLTMLDTDLGGGGLEIELAWMDLDIRDSNTVAGLPLRFVKGATGAVVNSSAGQVVVVDCQGAIVEDLTFTNISHPVMFLGSRGCTVRNCTIAGAYVAVQTVQGGSNRLEGITIVETDRVFMVDGVDVAYGDMTIDGLNLTGGDCGVHALAGPRLDVTNSSFADVGGRGIFVEPVTDLWGLLLKGNLTVSRCRLHNVSQGIVASYWNVTVRDTAIEECGMEGVVVDSSKKVVIERTGVSGSWSNGVFLDNDRECTISSLTARSCHGGLFVRSTIKCTVLRCNVSECVYGLILYMSSAVTVTECNVDNCTYEGIWIYFCSGCTLHHNNLIRNYYDGGLGKYTATQALDTSSDSVWDDGAEGNFWADYQQRYPSATASGRVWDTPYVISGNGLQDRYPITLRYDSTPPVAEAGLEQTVGENQTVWFDGRGSSDDIGIVNYTWEFVYKGQPVTLHGLTASYEFSGLATYTVTLWVIDAWGNVASDTTKVHVVDLVDPTPVAGDDLTVDAGRTFVLDGSLSTDDHGIVAYTWTVDPGGLGIVLHGASVELSIAVVGDYLAVLNVSDARGNWATDSLMVHVRDLSPPVADAGSDITVDQGTRVDLNGSASRDNVGIVDWNWTFEYDGRSINLQGPISPFLFEIPGRYDVTLTVWDAAGLNATDSLIVRVRDTVRPVASAGDDVIVGQDQDVHLDASGSSDNVGIVKYEWTFVDGGVSKAVEGETGTVRFKEAGSYTIILNVSDAEGNWATDDVVVTVRDTTAPVAEAGADITVAQHATVMLNGTGSRDNVGIIEFSWQFVEAGIAVTLKGPSPSRVFDVAGTFGVTLTVKDSMGNSATDTVTVTVLDTDPPVAVAGGDRSVIEGTVVTFNGTASHDNVGIVKYMWTVRSGDYIVHQLEGPLVRLDPWNLDIPLTYNLPHGVYDVEIQVADRAGNVGTANYTLTVLTRTIAWRLGPFLDDKGNNVEGAQVRVVLNGTAYVGLTDGWGWVAFQVGRYDLVSPAVVNATKGGYEPLKASIGLDELGRPTGALPTMEHIPALGLGSPLILAPLLVVIAIVLCAVGVALHRVSRKKRDGQGQ